MDELAIRTGMPRAVVNAMAALRRRGPIASAIGRPQYRAVLPYLASAVSQDCLAQTIEALDDHADDPTKEQLLEALEVVGESHSDATIAAMLVSVAAGDMAASDLCFEVVTGDDRFGLTGLDPAPGEDGEGSTTTEPGGAVIEAIDENGDTSTEASAEQRAARRDRRRVAAEQRRRRQEATQRAEASVRSRRKQGRAAAPPPVDRLPQAPQPGRERAVPTLVRRPTLTPSQLQEFDPGDPLVGALVSVWVPFANEEGGDGDGSDIEGRAGSDGESNEDGNGKLRPCVVIAVASEHLLVRPCYSDGGRKGHDWTSVPVRDWHRAGLDQPTWIGAETVRVPRPTALPSLGRLSLSDWNALW